jgi:hypothetical protein
VSEPCGKRKTHLGDQPPVGGPPTRAHNAAQLQPGCGCRELAGPRRRQSDGAEALRSDLRAYKRWTRVRSNGLTWKPSINLGKLPGPPVTRSGDPPIDRAEGAPNTQDGATGLCYIPPAAARNQCVTRQQPLDMDGTHKRAHEFVFEPGLAVRGNLGSAHGKVR